MCMSLVALLPAHNEQDNIWAAIDSLHKQTMRPDRIIVVADNCTDQTVDIARMLGADVFETVSDFWSNRMLTTGSGILALPVPLAVAV